MRVVVLSLVAAVGMASCAKPPPMRYSHATATQQVYMQDRFACLQQAQQNRSGAYVNAYGGSSESTVVTNRGLFMACMSAKGYHQDATGPLVTPPGSEIKMVD